MAIEKKVLVIIPAFNEEGVVGKVVEEVRHHLPQADILVVNDGSTDLTSDKAKASGATVLDLPFNLGIGGQCRPDTNMLMRKITILPFRWTGMVNMTRKKL